MYYINIYCKSIQISWSINDARVHFGVFIIVIFLIFFLRNKFQFIMYIMYYVLLYFEFLYITFLVILLW